ncbi:hypothetical protein BVC71_08365 [Marivivens niveibacter]|uniref:HPt domain-containing protein n=1 Tax=Marivivens niveibacter TaxID=1930667 RepID=A0A251X0C5_9RHOB|nr:hypothetical protein [Marivivens niveibacter]OUD09828.1 hypothetical protein BVC71_08365 [Marivivens niveibacter]
MTDLQPQKLDPIHRQSAIIRLSPPVGPQVDHFAINCSLNPMPTGRTALTLIQLIEGDVADISRHFNECDFSRIPPIATHISDVADRLSLPEIAFVATHIARCAEVVDGTAVAALIARCQRLVARAHDELEQFD